MLTVLFSAKGSPGVTSTALALAAVWPRPTALLEADPSQGDLIYRCRSAAGGPVAPSPNILGYASAVRGDRSTPVEQWAQRLANGVNLVPGLTSPAQARGLAGMWREVTLAASSSPVDIIVDLGRIDRGSGAAELVSAADARIPVVAATLESLIHTRETLVDLGLEGRGRTNPILVGPARTAAGDCSDLDEVLASGGVMASATNHLPLDPHGLAALLAGVNPKGKGRMAPLVRAARDITTQLAPTASELAVGQ